MDALPVLLVAIGLALGALALTFWIAMLVHYYRTDELRRQERVAWFLAMIFGKLLGAGVYYYEAKGMRYDGVWERDTPKAGVYESIDPGDVPVVNLPALELMDAEQVGERAKRAALASLSCVR